MATEWYYARGGSQIGPLSVDEAKQQLATDDYPSDAYLWHEGLRAWQQAADFAEFAPPKRKLPPPLPGSVKYSQPQTVFTAAVIGLVLSAVFAGVGVLTEGGLKPIDPYNIFNPEIIGHWIGRVGFIPLLFVIFAIAVTFRKHPFWISLLDLFGATIGIALVIGISTVVLAALQPIKEFPFRAEGPDRAGFIKTASESCVRKQRSLPENRGVSEKVIVDFCACSAKSLADRTSSDDLKEYSDRSGPSSRYMAKMTASYEGCRPNAAQ